MRKIILVALISGLTISAYSQEKPFKAPKKERNPEEMMKAQSERLEKDLELSDKQVKKLEEINSEYAKKLETKKKLREAMRSEGEQELLAYDKELKQILDKSQLEKYEVIKLKGKERLNSQKGEMRKRGEFERQRGKKSGKEARNSQGERREEMIEMRHEKLAKELELNKDQLKKFEQLNKKFDEKRKEMRQRHKSVLESDRDMMIEREIMIEKMLNDDQLKEFKKINKSQKRNRRK